MKKLLKRLVSLSLAVVMATGCVMSASASNEDSEYKYTSEFGTLYGGLYYSGIVAGDKETCFEVTISHLSNKISKTYIYAQCDIHDYYTGEFRDYDRTDYGWVNGINMLRASYYWHSHSSLTTDRLITAFGTHEARGYGSAVVYTAL